MPVKKTKKSKGIDVGTKAPFPKSISPMLATLSDHAPATKEWIYEIKWDGYRAMGFCHKNKVNLISRNQKSFNDKFYPIVESLSQLNINAVFDGEIVVLKGTGVSSFGDLQNWRSEADGELRYYVFDLLWIDGFSLTEVPLIERKKLLNILMTNPSYSPE